MATKTANQEPETHKVVITVVAFVASLIFMMTAAVFAYQYRAIQPYKTLATELNDTLGGGYKISYTWKCGLETSNCPSARMIKDADAIDEAEVNVELKKIENIFTNDRYTVRSVGECKKADNYGYCKLEVKHKESGLIIWISPREDGNFVDITS